MPVRLHRQVRSALCAAVTAVAVVAGCTAVASAAPTPAPTTSEVAPTPVPAGEKTTWRLGSFLLPPAPLGTAPLNRPRIELTKPCDDCFITGFVPRLVYADGMHADMRTGVMLHHIGLFDPTRPDPANQRCAWGGPVFGSGDERAPWFALPPGHGFKVSAIPWAGFVEVMNHAPVPREVHLEADVYTLPASTPGMKAVTPVMLSVADACSTMEYDVPAGRSATSMTWTSPITGRIVWGLGHVHAGGVGVLLTNATTGERICGSQAGYGKPHHKHQHASGRHTSDQHTSDPMANLVTSMSTCSWDSLGTVRAGEKLTVTSLYDAPRALSGVMGIMSLAVHDTADLAGGTRAPASMRRVPDTKVPRGVGGHGH